MRIDSLQIVDCAMADDPDSAGLLAVVNMDTVTGAVICSTGLQNYRFKGRRLRVRRAKATEPEEDNQPSVTKSVTTSSEAKPANTG